MALVVISASIMLGVCRMNREGANRMMVMKGKMEVAIAMRKRDSVDKTYGLIIRWSRICVSPGVCDPASGLSSRSWSPSFVKRESVSLALCRLIVSEEAVEWAGRIVGSSSVEPSKSVLASLAASDADAVEYVLENELDERR